VHGLLQQTTSDNYREELAKERSETERLFILTVLARKEAEGRRLQVSMDGRQKAGSEDVELRP
jgi:hypothetical protein